jgi:hypothetical protein
MWNPAFLGANAGAEQDHIVNMAVLRMIERTSWPRFLELSFAFAHFTIGKHLGGVPVMPFPHPVLGLRQYGHRPIVPGRHLRLTSVGFGFGGGCCEDTAIGSQ